MPSPPRTATRSPRCHRDGSVGTVLGALLKRPGSVIYGLHQPGAAASTLVLAVCAVVLLTCYGLTIGSFSGGVQWWAAPLKTVLGTFLSALICLPSLYIFASLSGAEVRLGPLCGMVLATLCLDSLLLVGFAPVAWVFSQSTESVAFMGTLHLFFWAVSIVFALRLVREMGTYTGARGVGYLPLWFGIFLLVCLQMTTALRPFVGRSDTCCLQQALLLDPLEQRDVGREGLMIPTTAPITRRRFLSRLALAGLLSGGAGTAYALRKAHACVVERVEVYPRHLPPALDGLTIAFLTDTHHGPFVSASYLEEVVRLTNALRPDVVALGGDYVQRRRPLYPQGNQRHLIAPGIAALAGLRAPLGRFAVLGNHDHKVSAMLTRRALAENGFTDLTNTGVFPEHAGARLYLGGVDDLRTGRPDLRRALHRCGPEDACVLLSHNPDFVERPLDPRVDLVLSGHTHGGQVAFPLVGAPFTASRYGQKYRAGLVQGATARVYVSRGIGTIGLPIRWGAPPEITLLTLRSDVAVIRSAQLPRRHGFG